MANLMATAAPQRASDTSTAAPTAVVPFVRASAEHRESTLDITRQITTSDQDLGIMDVNAYGWLRSLFVVVTANGGTGTGVTAKADSPFAALKGISLSEPNGAVIHSFENGYDLAMAGNKYGGFRNPLGSDPRQSPVFSAPAGTTGNFSYAVRIPVEINPRDGLGSLANQNSAATFKLRLTLAKASEIYGTVPTTLPNVRIQVWLEAWDQPEASVAGQANALQPPAPDTTQYFSSQVINFNAGFQTIPLKRVGNYIRSLTFITRDATGARADLMPSPATLYLDTRPIDMFDSVNLKNQMFERTGYGRALGNVVPALDSPGGLDTGVYTYDFTHEVNGQVGYEMGDLWLPTQTSTRLELQGTFSAPGSLRIITNDIALSQPVW